VSESAIFACLGPRGAHWQLGALPTTENRMTLIGWRQIPTPNDAGVPDKVAAILARALTSVARLTFPSSSTAGAPSGEWAPLAEDLVRSLGNGGLAERIRNTIGHVPATIALLSTRRPESAVRLFDDESFPWWLQGQVVVLSSPEAAPPDIDRTTVLSFLTDDWSKRAANLAPAGIAAVMRPGVDGDVAGLLSLTVAFETALLAALEKETSRAGFDWAVLEEDNFSEWLATRP
jgi:hypothetical protein